MKDEVSVSKTKEPYEKPRLRKIELAAEEVLAVGCKTSQTGFAPGSNVPPCMAQNCQRAGS
jgi:hypothetical protein